MAATLDQISGGRLIHFVDRGNRAAEFHVYGLPWAEPIEARIEHLAEELELTRALWTEPGLAERIQRYIDLGVTHFMWWFLDAPDEAGMHLFIDAVAPRFR